MCAGQSSPWMMLSKIREVSIKKKIEKNIFNVIVCSTYAAREMF
jgi:hypothetical protein